MIEPFYVTPTPSAFYTSETAWRLHTISSTPVTSLEARPTPPAKHPLPALTAGLNGTLQLASQVTGIAAVFHQPPTTCVSCSHQPRLHDLKGVPQLEPPGKIKSAVLRYHPAPTTQAPTHLCVPLHQPRLHGLDGPLQLGP